MRLPFVSRARFEDAQKQIEELKVVNAQLLTIALTRGAEPVQAQPEDEPAPQRPHRTLGAQIRSEFAAAAQERANQQASGAKK